MFYSGWDFSSPRRLVVRGGQQGMNCHVQETSSPGISLLHFFWPITQSVTPSQRRSGDSSDRMHVKSDVPIHPQSGVFYFEVQLRSLGNGAGGNASATGSEPALVIGVCRETLPPHKLPGEEACSIGLFTAQRMVYISGRSEGEAVRFPTGPRTRSAGNGVDAHAHLGSESSHPHPGKGDSHTPHAQEERRGKGLRVGDAVGCIVNLMDGTVRFTFNGEMMDVVGPLGRRMPKRGYYPAVGVLRLVPGLVLRVVFQPLGRTAMGAALPRPLANPDAANASSAGGSPQPEESTTAAGYFVFDVDKYCEGIADELVRIHREQMERRGENGADGMSDEEKDEGSSCRCRDASVIAAIRKHLATRGMTKALSAFEKEQAELQCPTAAEGATAGEPLGETRTKSKSGTRLRSSSSASNSNNNNNNNNNSNSSVHHAKPQEGQNSGSGLGENSSIAYSMHMQRLREDISRGDLLSSTRRILEEGILSPMTKEKVGSAVQRTDALPPSFWGLLFFAQRRDILFLLRAAHVVEVALNTIHGALLELQRHTNQDGDVHSSHNNNSSKHNNNNNSNNKNNNHSHNANEEACARGANPPAPHHPIPTATEIMEFAFRVLLEPFEALASAARRHRRAALSSPQTVEAAAFGEGGATGKWPCEELVSHLFFVGGETVWSGPEAPVTLLVRRSVPCVPAPPVRQQRRLVQSVAMLVAHARAVCGRLRAAPIAEADWLGDWRALLDAARTQYRGRCWRLLLHAIEDFNGAIEFRLLVWRRRHEEERRAGSHRMARNGGRLFPSLRAAWRHVHAAAALEPLLNIVTRAFSDRLNRTAQRAACAASYTASACGASFVSGPKRGAPFACDFVSGDEEETERGERAHNAMEESSGAHTRYRDDVRLSYLYMKNIYSAAFA